MRWKTKTKRTLGDAGDAPGRASSPGDRRLLLRAKQFKDYSTFLTANLILSSEKRLFTMVRCNSEVFIRPDCELSVQTKWFSEAKIALLSCYARVKCAELASAKEEQLVNQLS